MTDIKLALIDDNKTVLMINEAMLKKEKYINSIDTVYKYNSIEDFNKNTQDITCQYDIIVCDYDLGKDSINGLEFLKNILSKGFKGVCILLTGDDSLSMKTKMMLHSNINYIVKNNENPTHQLGKLIENHRNSIKE